MIKLINILIFNLITLSLIGQSGRIGVPFVKNYSPWDYSAKNDNWAIEQDERGIMYFGNKAGVLEFDGVNWKNIAPDVALLTMEKDKNGKVFGGGINEAGYISFSGKGHTEFISIIDEQKKKDTYFGNFYDIVFNNDTVYFFSNRGDLIKWFNNQLKHYKIAERITYAVKIQNSVFVISDEGLCTYNGKSLTQLKGGEQFFDIRARLLLALNDDTLLVVSRTKGLFTFANGILKPFKNPSNEFLIKNQVYRAIHVNNTIAFGTVGNGVLVTDLEGNSLYQINRAGGLQSNDHCAIFFDSRMNVWSGLEYGISCTYTNSPFTQINEQSNLINAAVYNVLVHNNCLYAGTAQGIYFVEWRGNSSISQPSFKRITDSESRKVWVLDSFDGDLISSSSNVGTYHIVDFKAKKISNHTAKELAKLKPNVLVGPIEHEALGIFIKEASSWQFKTQFENFPNLSNVIVDKSENIWAIDNAQRIVHIKLNNQCDNIIETTNFDTIPGLLSFKKVSLFMLNDEVCLGTPMGTFLFNGREFVNHINLNKSIGSDIQIQSIKEDINGTKWIIGLKDGIEVVGEIMFAETDKDQVAIKYSQLRRISDYQIFSFYPYDSQNLFFGSSEKIIHYNPSKKSSCNDSFAVHIRSVETLNPVDSVIFGGAFIDASGLVVSQPSKNIPLIRYKNNGIRFKYSAIFYEGSEKTKYQIKLDGFDKEWSDWISKTEKEYSYLKEGKYKFCVKARNVYGVVSAEECYTFVILPPWYRTVWAYLTYFLLIISGVIAIVNISIYRIKKDKEKLEKIVAERTAQVNKQKEEILVQNQILYQNSEEILAQNERLNEQNDEILAQSEMLKQQNKKISDQNLEITESIKYASNIQMALQLSEQELNDIFPQHFILYKPLQIVSGDFYWIKQINEVIVIAIADCTGHGIPGAFMSMLGISYLNEIVRKREVTKASEVLNQMRTQVKQSLGLTGNKELSRDGIELGLVVIYKDKCEMEYAGAHIPLVIIRRIEGIPTLIEIKPDLMPIGKHLHEKETFTNHIIPIDPTDNLYMFTDGYTDQIHSEGNKKFSRSKLKEILTVIQDVSMLEQKEILESALDEWAGNRSQIDDILVAGFSIGPICYPLENKGRIEL